MFYDIFKVGIVGGGTMGGGIAALFARQGLPVIVKEATDELAAKARAGIMGRFQKWFDKGKIGERRLEELRSLVEVTSCSRDLADVDFFIEAVQEDIGQKRNVFGEFGGILRKGVVMVSNTSSIPISDFADMSGRPACVAGMHFFNPPTTMRLIELVRGAQTSDETMKVVEEFAHSTLQKTVVRVVDKPGFLVNRLLLPYLSEAVLGVEEARVLLGDIEAQALEAGWPAGPFTLLDMVGLDVAVFVARFLSESYGDRVKMGTLFKELLAQGRLGDKVGAGFYSNDESGEPIEEMLKRLYPNRRTDVAAADIYERMFSGVLNESVFVLEEKVASPEDIETGALFGIGFPGTLIGKVLKKSGPLHAIDDMGAEVLLETLERLQKTFGPRFAPHPRLREMAASGEKFFSW